jgi:hypothetical protein
MDRELDRQGGCVKKSEAWDQVVTRAGPGEHIVQLYQDHDFLNRAVCRFAGAAVENAAGIIPVPALTHWNAFPPLLEGSGRGRGSGTGTGAADDC